MPKPPKSIIEEAYFLRTTFFIRQLDRLGYVGVVERVVSLAENYKSLITWDDRKDIGISDSAWRKVQENGEDPILLFAHPAFIRNHPTFIKYYRGIALLPLKGLQALSGVSNIKELEDGKRDINENSATKIIPTINEIISAAINLEGNPTREKIKAMIYANAGTTIDGSWRNAIGAEGERVIKQLIFEELNRHEEIERIILKSEKTLNASAGKFDAVDSEKIRTIFLKSQYSITFKSEPDVTISNSAGRIVGGIEIKAGLDPAGALERLGAMLKSFENIKQSYPEAVTILVASCITDEVQSRLNSTQSSVNLIYTLTDITLNKRGEASRLVNKIRELSGLVGRRL